MRATALIRATSIAVAGLTLASGMAAAPEPCGLQVIAQHEPGSSQPSTPVSISGDGRFIAFSSYARLLPGDTNERSDIYVFDAVARQLTIESVLTDGRQSNSDSFAPDLSDDGRLVVFESIGRLVSTDPEDLSAQVVIRDRQNGTTRLLSANAAGRPGNHRSGHATISADGSVVAFESAATNLVADADANGLESDVYAVVVASQEVARVSVTSAGRQVSDGSSFGPSISADGRLIAFTSSAPIDRNSDPLRSGQQSHPRSAIRHVFVRDRARDTTRRVSRLDRGEPNGPSYLPSISADGRWVAFVSQATNVVSGDDNDASDVFLHDLHTSKTALISRKVGGGTATGSSTRPSISADGAFVAFESAAADLVCSRRCAPRDRDINLLSDIFVFDRARDLSTRASADTEAAWLEPSRSPAIAANAQLVAFSSRRPMDPGDARDDYDLFVRRRCM